MVNVMPRIRNFTSEEVFVHLPGHDVVLYPSEGIARVQESVNIEQINAQGVHLVRTVYGRVNGLPEPVEGVLIIVSPSVKTAAARNDLVIPTDLVEGEEPGAINCRALSF